MNNEEVMKYFVVAMSFLGMGVIWPQYTYCLKKVMEEKKIKINDILFLLIFPFTLVLMFFISQKIGIAHVFKFTSVSQGVLSMNMFIAILLLLILMVSFSAIQAYSYQILTQLQNKRSIPKNLFKYTLIGFILGVVIFIMTLICYRFFPDLS